MILSDDDPPRRPPSKRLAVAFRRFRPSESILTAHPLSREMSRHPPRPKCSPPATVPPSPDRSLAVSVAFVVAVIALVGLASFPVVGGAVSVVVVGAVAVAVSVRSRSLVVDRGPPRLRASVVVPFVDCRVDVTVGPSRERTTR